MTARFELSTDEHGHFSFTLKGDDGVPLFFGLTTDSRRAVGLDIVHTRKAVRDLRHFVPHEAPDGAFVVLKDTGGAVLGKSAHVQKEKLKALVAMIHDLASGAEIVEPTASPAPSSYH